MIEEGDMKCLQKDTNTPTKSSSLSLTCFLRSPFKLPLHITQRLAAGAQNSAQNSNWEKE